MRLNVKHQKIHDRKFNAAVVAMLRRLGAGDNVSDSYPLRLETRLGPLLLSVMDGWLATRFIEVDRACEALNPRREWGGRFNPYSGKWNFHFPCSWTVPASVDYIESEIKALLAAQQHDNSATTGETQ